MKNHKAWVLAVVASVLVPAATVWAANEVPSWFGSSVTINCAADGCTVPINAEVKAQVAEEQTFGGTSHLGSLKLNDDLTVLGDVTINGSISNTAGSFGQAVSSTASTSATTTACAIQNTSGRGRTVLEATVLDRGTAASTGLVSWTVSTSSVPGVVSTATKIVDTGVTRLSGVDRITTTSTLATAQVLWENGGYLVFSSNTTTNNAVCHALYY